MTSVPISITFDQLVTRSDDVLFQEVGGEAVLLDLASEKYFGLDPVGSRIWELLDGQTNLNDIHLQLSSEYDADPTRIRDDLVALLQELLAAGLVRQI